MKESEIEFYNKKVKNFRGTPAQVGYGSLQSQHIRFHYIRHELFKFIKDTERKCSVLDFGCGTGYFYDQMKHFEYINYTGIDAIKENIDDAIAGDITRTNKFKHINADETFPYENYDFIVFSGPFSTTEPSEKIKLYETFLQKAKIGVIGNFIRYNSLVPKYEDGCYLTNPSEILRLIDPSEFKFNLIADYMPHDFTISAIRWEPSL